MKVKIEVIKRVTYTFDVDAVMDEYNDIDLEQTYIKASEEYEKALENNELPHYYSDEDYEYQLA